MQILLSKEHSQYSKEVADCFQGLDAAVDASYMRLSEGDLPMQVIISLVTNLFSSAIYDYLKPSIQKFYKKFSNAHVLIRAPEGIMFSVDANGAVRPIVVPHRAAEFAGIKTIDDLMKYLKGEEKVGWIETTLGAVTDYINRGIPPVYVDDGILVLNQRCIRDGKVSYEDSRFSSVDKKIPQGKLLQENDILICSTGVGTLGRVGQIRRLKAKTTVDSHVSIVRPSKDVDSRFLGFLLKSSERDIELMAEGSTGQTELPRTKLASFRLSLPPLPEQHAIAAMLSSLDDKIELLREQNKTFEAMAKELFHEWFTDFNFPDADGKPYKKSSGKMIDSELGEIPEGWRVGRFTEIAEILSGGTPKTDVEEYWEGSIPFFTPKDAADTFYVMNTEKNLTELGLKNCNSRLYSKNTVFITARGTVGKCTLSSRDMAMNQSCYALRGINISNLYLFLLLKNLVESLKRNASGSVFDAITVSTFHSLPVVIPTEIVISKFADTVSPFFQKILDNLSQIKILSKIRDELLPRLINHSFKHTI